MAVSGAFSTAFISALAATCFFSLLLTGLLAVVLLVLPVIVYFSFLSSRFLASNAGTWSVSSVRHSKGNLAPLVHPVMLHWGLTPMPHLARLVCA
jgi:hypothetical protein